MQAELNNGLVKDPGAGTYTELAYPHAQPSTATVKPALPGATVARAVPAALL